MGAGAGAMQNRNITPKGTNKGGIKNALMSGARELLQSNNELPFSPLQMRLCFRAFDNVSLGQDQMNFETFASIKTNTPRQELSVLFDIIDQDKDGIIVFEEFVSGLSLLCQGTMREKLSLLFHIYNEDHKSAISPADAKKMLVDVDSTSLTLALVHQTIERREKESYEKVLKRVARIATELERARYREKWKHIQKKMRVIQSISSRASRNEDEGKDYLVGKRSPPRPAQGRNRINSEISRVARPSLANILQMVSPYRRSISGRTGSLPQLLPGVPGNQSAVIIPDDASQSSDSDSQPSVLSQASNVSEMVSQTAQDFSSTNGSIVSTTPSMPVESIVASGVPKPRPGVMNKPISMEAMAVSAKPAQATTASPKKKRSRPTLARASTFSSIGDDRNGKRSSVFKATGLMGMMAVSKNVPTSRGGLLSRLGGSVRTPSLSELTIPLSTFLDLMEDDEYSAELLETIVNSAKKLLYSSINNPRNLWEFNAHPTSSDDWFADNFKHVLSTARKVSHAIQRASTRLSGRGPGTIVTQDLIQRLRAEERWEAEKRSKDGRTSSSGLRESYCSTTALRQSYTSAAAFRESYSSTSSRSSKRESYSSSARRAAAAALSSMSAIPAPRESYSSKQRLSRTNVNHTLTHIEE